MKKDGLFLRTFEMSMALISSIYFIYAAWETSPPTAPITETAQQIWSWLYFAAGALLLSAFFYTFIRVLREYVFDKK